MAKLTLESSAWLILMKKWKAERINTSYNEKKIQKFHEQLFPIAWEGIIWVDAF